MYSGVSTCVGDGVSMSTIVHVAIYNYILAILELLLGILFIAGDGVSAVSSGDSEEGAGPGDFMIVEDSSDSEEEESVEVRVQCTHLPL